MNSELFGNVRIFRPSVISNMKMREEAEGNLRSKFSEGIYTNSQDINSILQHQFKFYSQILEKIIQHIASRHFMEFILFQFDQATLVDDMYKSKTLSAEEDRRWERLGPAFRRGIKFLAESVTLLQPGEVPDAPKDSLETFLDDIWICAEQMVDLYLLSDQTVAIFPDDTILTIFPEGRNELIDLKLQKEHSIHEAVRRDAANRDQFVGQGLSDYLTNISDHDKYLGDLLREKLGASYIEIIKVLYNLIKKAQSASHGFPVLFLNKSNILKLRNEATNISEENLEKILSGFTLTKEKMKQEGCEIWKSKQEYRAYRRGFFEMPHPTGPHIAFSKQMALECMTILISGIVFKQFPTEWRNTSIDSALATISNNAGSWFEDVVKEKFDGLGFIGLKSVKKGIGKGDKYIKIPAEVGEIDYLGYSVKENILLIAECKMVNSGSESKFFRDEIHKFITSKKSYLNKYRKKVEWVRANIDNIVIALNSTDNIRGSIKLERIATLIITYYPNIVECFIEEFPCVSITNLMLDYMNLNKWPYSKGVFNIN